MIPTYDLTPLALDFLEDELRALRKSVSSSFLIQSKVSNDKWNDGTSKKNDKAVRLYTSVLVLSSVLTRF